MMERGFTVTYEIVTQESAECGDIADSGFISENQGLREAIADLFETRTSHCGGMQAIEANEWPMQSPQWVSVFNGAEFQTGDHENRSLHFPEHITAASRVRICRLIGAQ